MFCMNIFLLLAETVQSWAKFAISVFNNEDIVPSNEITYSSREIFKCSGGLYLALNEGTSQLIRDGKNVWQRHRVAVILVKIYFQ